MQAGKLLDDYGVSDDDVEKLVTLSLSVLHRHKIYPHRERIETLEDEDSDWLNFTIEVSRPPAEVVNLDFEAAEQLAKSKIPTKVTDAVIVNFSSKVN